MQAPAKARGLPLLREPQNSSRKPSVSHCLVLYDCRDMSSYCSAFPFLSSGHNAIIREASSSTVLYPSAAAVMQPSTWSPHPSQHPTVLVGLDPALGAEDTSSPSIAVLLTEPTNFRANDVSLPTSSYIHGRKPRGVDHSRKKKITIFKVQADIPFVAVLME